jgi:Tol biopolymer transport system component
VRDLRAHTTTLVSRSSARPGPRPTDISYFACISADGRFVAFSSGRPFGERFNVYVRDLRRHTTKAINVGARYHSAFPSSISAHGRFVAVGAYDRNLVDHVIVSDLRNHTTTLISPGRHRSYAGSLSADGRLVVFSVETYNRGTDTFDRGVFLNDLRTHTTAPISPGSQAALSADGHSVVFDAEPQVLIPDGPGGPSQVWVRDRRSATTVLASRATGPDGVAGNAESDPPFSSPSISADGRRVTFVSTSTNLTPSATESVDDVFVRDVASQTTTLISRASGDDGAKGNHRSLRPAISADGRFVAFDSGASNLTADDPGKQADVFVRELQTEGS